MNTAPVQSNLPPSVSAIDLTRVSAKLRANRSAVAGAPLDVDLAEREYRRFLTLRLLHPEATLVPTGVIDEYWHQHILDTQSYGRDCVKMFGGFMDHDPYFGTFSAEEAEENARAFEETKELYQRTFSEPLLGEAHRCSSKDCRGGGRALPIRPLDR